MTEYELLRQEILAWQERRFTVLTGSITLVVAILGFVLLEKQPRWSRELLLIVVFMVLAIATLFTWYAGWTNTIAGAYLGAFHENSTEPFFWQTARRALMISHPLVGWLNVNVFFALIYCAVGGAGFAIAYLHCKPDPEPKAQWAAGAMLAFFAFTVVLTALYSTPYATYEPEWSAIRDQLRASRPTPTP